MMLATEYTYSIADEGDRLVVTLCQTKTNLTKVFVMAGVRYEAAARHMDSLTDACCVDFFPKPKKEKKGK